ncbi:hypothetical protein DEU52_106135 [Ensifer adhaerens]|nr:hypothetical protein DEU52_106135 [Ensifer adhaerens]
MSYTVILDYAEERRLTENRINAMLRHCKIGKVSPKPPKHWGKLTLPKQPIIPRSPNQCVPMPSWQNPVVSVC